MSHIYISDTNIWIDFRNAGLLDKLFQLPVKLCCTDFVVAELEDFDHKQMLGYGLIVETLESAATLKLFDLMEAHNNSSLADVSCYFLAKETNRPLLTGDGRLRRQAMRDQIDVHGALWLMDALVAHQIVTPDTAANALARMLEKGARLPQAECQSRLKQWSK